MIRKNVRVFLILICGPIPRVAFLSLKTVHCFTDPPGCAWSVERRGYLRSRRGSQDMVGGDKPLIVDSVEEYPF